MKIKELGHVVLYVSNLERSAKFYGDVLGFGEVTRMGNQAVVYSGGRTHHELMLLEVDGEPDPKTNAKPGLYHIGFKIGDSPEEARKAYQELKKEGVSIVGTGDHGITHSIYILDPDGNEIELYADVSNDWKKDPKALITPVKPLNLD